MGTSHSLRRGIRRRSEELVPEAKIRNVRAKSTPSLHDTYSHREREHDDLLLALAVAAPSHVPTSLRWYRP
jgi:hypothetical protein